MKEVKSKKKNKALTFVVIILCSIIVFGLFAYFYDENLKAVVDEKIDHVVDVITGEDKKDTDEPGNNIPDYPDEEEKIFVYLDLDNGSNLILYELDLGQILPEPDIPTKSGGWVFKNWTSTIPYIWGQPVQENMTITAIYIKTYEVSLNFNNQFFDIESEDFIENYTIVRGDFLIVPTLPTPEDYFVFDGWIEEGTTNIFKNQVQIQRDMILKAKFRDTRPETTNPVLSYDDATKTVSITNATEFESVVLNILNANNAQLYSIEIASFDFSSTSLTSGSYKATATALDTWGRETISTINIDYSKKLDVEPNPNEEIVNVTFKLIQMNSSVTNPLSEEIIQYAPVTIKIWKNAGEYNLYTFDTSDEYLNGLVIPLENWRVYEYCMIDHQFLHLNTNVSAFSASALNNFTLYIHYSEKPWLFEETLNNYGEIIVNYEFKKPSYLGYVFGDFYLEIYNSNHQKIYTAGPYSEKMELNIHEILLNQTEFTVANGTYFYRLMNQEPFGGNYTVKKDYSRFELTNIYQFPTNAVNSFTYAWNSGKAYLTIKFDNSLIGVNLAIKVDIISGQYVLPTEHSGIEVNAIGQIQLTNPISYMLLQNGNYTANITLQNSSLKNVNKFFQIKTFTVEFTV